MEILGIGPMELILILIVALMVFGPDKLPQIGAKLGRGMRDMRRATRAISDEINSTRAAVEGSARELAEPFQEVAGAAKAASSVAAAARNPGQVLRDSVMRELNAPVEREETGEQAAAEENRIAPPQMSVQSQEGGGVSQPSTTSEPPAALPQPDVPVAALPAPEEPAAALPVLDEPAQLPAPETSTAAPQERAASEPSEMDDDRPAADTTDPLASTSPEQ